MADRNSISDLFLFFGLGYLGYKVFAPSKVAGIGKRMDLPDHFEFDWDERNLYHLLVDNEYRKIRPNEVESAFIDPNKVINNAFYKNDLEEQRYYCLGKSNKNRLLFVSFIKKDNRIRPITAWEATRNKHLKEYEKG